MEHLPEAPPAFEKIGRATRTRILRIEGQALAELGKAREQATAAVLGALAVSGAPRKRAAFGAVHQAALDLREQATTIVARARDAARALAQDRVGAELAAIGSSL